MRTRAKVNSLPSLQHDLIEAAAVRAPDVPCHDAGDTGPCKKLSDGSCTTLLLAREPDTAEGQEGFVWRKIGDALPAVARRQVETETAALGTGIPIWVPLRLRPEEVVGLVHVLSDVNPSDEPTLLVLAVKVDQS
jgi:hypothetical protein